MTNQDNTQAELRKFIGEKVGEATMQWEPIPSGVFKSDTAGKIVTEIDEAIISYTNKAVADVLDRLEARIDEVSVIGNMCHKNGPYIYARELTYTDFLLASRKRTSELNVLKEQGSYSRTSKKNLQVVDNQGVRK